MSYPFIIQVKRFFWDSKGDINGFTICPFVFIKEKTRDEDEYKTLINHELFHIKQQVIWYIIGALLAYFVSPWCGLIALWFYVKYAYYYLRVGYENIPYEIEAYKHQDDWKDT